MALDESAWLWLTTSTIAEIATPKLQPKLHNYKTSCLLCSAQLVAVELQLCLDYVDLQLDATEIPDFCGDKLGLSWAKLSQSWGWKLELKVKV